MGDYKSGHNIVFVSDVEEKKRVVQSLGSHKSCLGGVGDDLTDFAETTWTRFRLSSHNNIDGEIS